MDTNSLIAIFSAFIAAVSAGISIFSVFSVRKHYRFSLRPIVDVRWTGGNSIQCHLENFGSGVALIKSFALNVDGKIFKVSTVKDLYNAMQYGFDSFSFCPPNDVQLKLGFVGKYLQPKDNFCLINIEYKDDCQDTKRAFEQVIERISLEVEYESIYGERFISKLESYFSMKGFTGINP